MPRHAPHERWDETAPGAASRQARRRGVAHGLRGCGMRCQRNAGLGPQQRRPGRSQREAWRTAELGVGLGALHLAPTDCSIAMKPPRIDSGPVFAACSATQSSKTFR